MITAEDIYELQSKCIVRLTIKIQRKTSNVFSFYYLESHYNIILHKKKGTSLKYLRFLMSNYYLFQG